MTANLTKWCLCVFGGGLVDLFWVLCGLGFFICDVWGGFFCCFLFVLKNKAWFAEIHPLKLPIPDIFAATPI